MWILTPQTNQHMITEVGLRNNALLSEDILHDGHCLQGVDSEHIEVNEGRG